MVLVFWTKIGKHRLVRQIGGCGARQFVVGFEAPVPDGKVTVLEFKISFIRLKTRLKYMLFLFSIKLSNIAKEKKRVQLRFAKCKVFFLPRLDGTDAV